MVIVFGTTLGAVFSTGRALDWVDQTFVSHQEVAGRQVHPISDWAIGGVQLQWAHLRAKDLEQMSHEKGFSLVSVVVH